MSELAKCRLCGGEALDCSAIKIDIPYTNCTNEDCPMSKHTVDKVAWNILNAPDPRVTALVKENEALRNLCGEAADAIIEVDAEYLSGSQTLGEVYNKLKEVCDNGIEGGSDV